MPTKNPDMDYSDKSGPTAPPTREVTQKSNWQTLLEKLQRMSEERGEEEEGEDNAVLLELTSALSEKKGQKQKKGQADEQSPGQHAAQIVHLFDSLKQMVLEEVTRVYGVGNLTEMSTADKLSLFLKRRAELSELLTNARAKLTAAKREFELASTAAALRSKAHKASEGALDNANTHWARMQKRCGAQKAMAQSKLDSLVGSMQALGNVASSYANLSKGAQSSILDRSTISMNVYDYRPLPWGMCTVTCGIGQQTRGVACVAFNGSTVDLKFCESKSMPVTTTTCIMPRCAVPCIFSQYNWLPCSTTCGEGVQTGRRAMLQGDEHCLQQGLSTQRSCLLQSCEPDVFRTSFQLDACRGHVNKDPSGRVMSAVDHAGAQMEVRQLHEHFRPSMRWSRSLNCSVMSFHGNMTNVHPDGVRHMCSNLQSSPHDGVKMFSPRYGVTMAIVARYHSDVEQASARYGFLAGWHNATIHGAGALYTDRFESQIGSLMFKPPPPKKWALYVVRAHPDGGLEVYVNGVKVAEAPVERGVFFSTEMTKFVIGADTHTCFPSFDGEIAEVRVLEGAARPKQLQALITELMSKWKL